MSPTQTIEVRVWDPFVRTSHWLLAIVVIIDWFMDEPRWIHAWLGYLAALLIVLRGLWDFIGPEHAPLVRYCLSGAEP
jgi:cytochrome b